MAVSSSSQILSLFDTLQNSSLPIEILEKIRMVLNSIPLIELKKIVPNISLEILFEFLSLRQSTVHISSTGSTTSNIIVDSIPKTFTTSDQTEVCCDILDSALSSLESSQVFSKYQADLELGLSKGLRVKSLCLQQILRSVNEDPNLLNTNARLVSKLIELLSDDLDISTPVLKSLILYNNESNDVGVLFEGTFLEDLKKVMSNSDVIRFRIYELVVKCSVHSDISLKKASIFLDMLISEFSNDDLLIQLNSLEMFTELALSERGLAYLENHGVIIKLEEVITASQTSPVSNLLIPGVIKFFGNVAHLHPKEISGKYKTFLELIFNQLDSADTNLQMIAMESICVIGLSADGKLALQKTGTIMNHSFPKMMSLISSSNHETKTKAIIALSHLFNLQISNQTEELLVLMESWLNKLTAHPFSHIYKLLQQPFAEIRIATMKLTRTLAEQRWAQKLMNNGPSFKEYLLNRSTESDISGKQHKYDVIKTLSDSPTSLDVFGRPYYLKLKTYVNEGPFYLESSTHVALEEES